MISGGDEQPYTDGYRVSFEIYIGAPGEPVGAAPARLYGLPAVPRRVELPKLRSSTPKRWGRRGCPGSRGGPGRSSLVACGRTRGT